MIWNKHLMMDGKLFLDWNLNRAALVRLYKLFPRMDETRPRKGSINGLSEI